MKRFYLFFIPIFVVVLTGLLGIILYRSLSQPVNKNDATQILFVVPPGDGTIDIGNRLQKEGLIKNSLVFRIVVKRLGLGNKIQAGDFRLSKSMSTEQIAQELTHGALDVWVQIKEGMRAEEIAEVLKETMPGYENTWVAALKKNEGYLFPDTYLMPKNADIDFIVNLLTGTFDAKIADLQPKVGKNGLTLEESIILASMVEREARTYEVRNQIASVMLKRLDLGMKLDIDATVQYALGFSKAENSWWKKELTFADLEINSPYNTYRNAGLPPRPISNPGLVAIKAVLDATPNTPYLFYLHDAQGNTHFGKTLEEHEANKAKYL